MASIENCVHVTILRRAKKKLITAANCSNGNISADRKHQEQGSRNWKKNNCFDISRDKLVRLPTRRRGHDYEREISRKKLKLFK